MYFSSQLDIDPSLITQIEKVKPTKVFGKLLDFISLGLATEKQETETFTAVVILQQLNMSLRSIKINNVIRLAVNDYDFYLDEKGEEDDLEHAMLHMEVKIDSFESQSFDAVYLVLEHEDKQIKYLIEITVARKHPVGEYPIKVKVNGILSEFKLNSGEDRKQLENRMGGVFSNQKKYDGFLQQKEHQFNQFVDELEMAVKRFTKTDDTRKKISKQLIRPKQKVQNKADIQNNREADPMFYGYYGFSDFLFYSYMWSSMSHHNNIYINNTNVVDESGNEVMSVGEEGFNAGDSNTLNDEADFEAPTEGDVEYHGDNDYQDEIQDGNLMSDDAYGGDSGETESSWFGGGDDSGGDSGSCSSCSSCSSCGGCS